MRTSVVLMAALVIGGLAGCVAPPPQQPVPLVAVPGPAKTEAQFRADDAACRASAAEAPADAPSQPTAAELAPGQDQSQANPANAAVFPAGVVYLRCMTVRQNTVEPLALAQPVLYGYYPAYPIYAGIGFGDPFFYDDVFGFGFYRGGYGRFYGGYGFGRFGYGGFRNYGYGYGGYRHGGYGGGGYRGGGFGGGGFHGGGFGGGGFHGGGFHGGGFGGGGRH